MRIVETLAFALLASALNCSHASAQFVDPHARFTDACNMLEATATIGLTDVRENQFMKDCASHPKKKVCEDTFAWIKKQNKLVPAGLRCTGK